MAARGGEGAVARERGLDVGDAGLARAGQLKPARAADPGVAGGHVPCELLGAHGVLSPVAAQGLGVSCALRRWQACLVPAPVACRRGLSSVGRAAAPARVYEISKRTGAILWRLGGKHSSFKFGPGAGFEWQHDARMHPDGTITLFDNGTGPAPRHESQSRGLRLRLNFKTHRATLVKAYTNDPPLLSVSAGDVQILPDGNVFVGWGAVPNFTEFSAGGRQLFSVYFHGDMQTYRAQRFNWWGQPATPPGIAVSATQQGTRVYASWNGATGVASWRVLAGPSPSRLKPIAEFPRRTSRPRWRSPAPSPTSWCRR